MVQESTAVARFCDVCLPPENSSKEGDIKRSGSIAAIAVTAIARYGVTGHLLACLLSSA
jgi:hypothetical protein